MESHNIARTKEGHAAQAGVDKWILIQENTFRNWVNEQLRPGGMEVISLDSEFDDGVKLCLLIQSLQGKRIRVIKNPKNHHQQLANVTEALQAIANDNIKLVNIGPEDIVNGNLKLILGLIWHLILRYQIGKSKFPTKKLMLAWLQAVIPEYKINNFTSDWNDGIALNALIEFCKPGLCPDWRNLSRSDGFNNCRAAMTLAKAHFDIPLVVRPEDLSSSDLDELSGMTYLSYFMKLDSPGYNMTLTLVKRLVRNQGISNFTTAWSDGRLMCALVTSVGGHIPGWPSVGGDNIQVMQLALDAARVLHIEPILGAKELCDPEVDHIGIMAYVAYFLKFKPTMAPAEKVIFSNIPAKSYVGKEASFSITLADDDVSPGDIRAEVTGADSTHKVHFNWAGRSGQGYFTASETGLHKLMIFCEGQVINGCPASFKVLADPSKVTFTTVDMCSIGASTEFKVNSAAAGDGEVAVKAKSPSGRSLNLSTMPRQGGNYVSNFNPSEVGEWEISVLYDNQHISGSPYIVNVFDPSLVKVFGLEGGNMADGINFNADATRAGRGNVRAEVMYGRTDVTEHMRLREDQAGFYKMNFTPPQPGLYKVHMYFNDVEIRGSPYDLDIVDSSNITVSGNGLSLVPVNRTASFVIHGVSGSGKLDVEIIGDHKVTVTYGGKKIQGSPYTVRVYDTGRVAVSNMPSSGLLVQPVVFDIDASKAGSGNIEIMINGGEIACSVQNHGNYRFTASFLPVSIEYHTIEMKFNKEHVPGSPWRIAIADAKSMTVSGRGLEYVQVNKTASFSIIMNNLDPKQLAVSILDPHRNSVQHKLKNKNNQMKVKYTPMEIGDYTITLKYGEQELTGSPFVAKAYNTTAIKVTDIPDGVVGQPIEFGIDVRKAGEGQLEIMVNSGTLPNTVESQETGVYKMSFTPEEAGQQKVEIIFNQEQHPDSPFTCNAVSLTAVQVRSFELQLPVDKSASFYLDLERALDVNVDIISPTGDNVKAKVSSQGSGYKVEWKPKVAGRHIINIQYGGMQIPGSPFYVDVFDLASIRVDNFRQGTVGDEAGFSVDFSGAGMLEQEVQIVGPSGVDVVYDTRELGHLWRDYIYEAEEPGRYQIYVRYAGFELPGCPFTQEIADGGMPSASGSGLFFAEQDKPAQFIVDVGRRKGDLRVSVNGPTSVGRCTVDPNTDGSYTVTYVPVETGIFNVNLSWNGTDIPGSPYHPKVVDVRKVRVIGGWQHFMDSNERVNLVVGERKQLPFDIAEAGPGTLRAEVKGPSGSLHASVDNHTMGKSVVEFIPEEEGSHYIHLFWSDLPLVNSPFHGYAIQQVPDASKLILTGRGLKEATVREEAEFVIDGSQAGKGSPDVVLSGVRDEVNVRVSPLGNGKFRCNYVATVPGAYLLHITWNGRQLRGSPYKVNVIGAFYPNRVVVSGEGLRGGILGQRIDVVIDTRKAGPGELTAHCMGPHQVAFCELADSKDGTFNLGIKAQESGRHVLQIKYGGEHVEGSPFTFKVNSRPDASKVRVHGPGVENGILATYVSKFIVETKGAGAGQLTVRIRGPKGAFQVEMYRDSQRDRTIVCRFDPTECGLYIIQVRWSNVDVPGSPFNVHILDTTEELEQVLNENSYSIGTPRSQSSYGNRPATRMVHQGGSLPAPRTQYGQWRGQVYPGQ
ncbi:filamin-B-like isoform X2 [Dreissena polymorpha]|uniref:filamin-B-like isoform X2 n=1 Tax=Dreissena polymorpha TaxID=45954 RepID=UPI002263CB00|nr:filamin-B-like isoform X2 [Dreissena polymorpha]